MGHWGWARAGKKARAGHWAYLTTRSNRYRSFENLEFIVSNLEEKIKYLGMRDRYQRLDQTYSCILFWQVVLIIFNF
jgi:hypothetical protein